MASRGRKNAYEEKIKPRLGEIEQWARDGIYESEMIERLGVSSSTFYLHKALRPEFSELIKNSRIKLVSECYKSLRRLVNGDKYTETKTYKKKTDTGEEIVCQQITEKQKPPDLGAIHLCLKNWDSERWSNEPNMIKIKKQELELKKKIAEMNHF